MLAFFFINNILYVYKQTVTSVCGVAEIRAWSGIEEKKRVLVSEKRRGTELPLSPEERRSSCGLPVICSTKELSVALVVPISTSGLSFELQLCVVHLCLVVQNVVRNGF